MPRTYIRKKPETLPVTEEQMARAKELIEKGKSKRAAASAIGISESGLRKRLKLNNVVFSMGRFKPTFNANQEAEFVSHCKLMDERFFGLTINDLRRLAYEYAAANNIENRFDKTSKMAGRDWVECFLKRHPELVIRQSAGTSLARAIGFNKVQVDRFYKNLKELYEKYKFKPSRIYNMDETGMNTVPKKTPKIITTKGKKVVAKIVTAERGITVTAICCMSAIGHYIPPALIYPRKRKRDDLLDGGPMQSVCMLSGSGFVNTELFVNWLHHFKDFVNPTLEDPVLLLLDNHVSHISLDGVKYARENNIVMLTLPPHGSHKLQPLDRCVFSPLKVKYSFECDKFMSQHPGRGITIYQVARLFNEAYKKVATIGNAESGFRVTGIYPYDDDLFDEVDFAPSLVTDQIFDVVQNNNYQPTSNESAHTVRAEPSSNSTPRHDATPSPSLLDFDLDRGILEALAANGVAEFVLQQEPPSTANSSKDTSVENRSDYSQNQLASQPEPPNPPIDPASTADSSKNSSARSAAAFVSQSEPPMDPPPTAHTSNDTGVENRSSFSQNQFVSQAEPPMDPPSTVNASKHLYTDKSIGENKQVLISQLSPLPQMKEKRNRTGKVSMKSTIITASPFKEQLEKKVEEKLEEQRLKEEKQRKRKVPKITFDGPANNKRSVTSAQKVTPDVRNNKKRSGVSDTKKTPNVPATKKTRVLTATKNASILKKKNEAGIPKIGWPSTSEEKDYFCPLCKENYIDPPLEEWIKCNVCEEWWHEQCTFYEQGVFVCDNCTDK